jgi:hypothetical protein
MKFPNIPRPATCVVCFAWTRTRRGELRADVEPRECPGYSDGGCDVMLHLKLFARKGWCLTGLLHHLNKLFKVDAALAVMVEMLNHTLDLLVGHGSLLLDILSQSAHVFK